MKRISSIQIKAAILLIVFALNTVIGFACAMGVNMGFNPGHNHDEEATEIFHHEHSKGKIHEHHHEVTKHKHDKKDDCCNDKVIQIQAMDKMLAQNAKNIFSGHDFATVPGTYHGIDIFKAFSLVPFKYTIPTFHPPPPDILIAIQRFQI